MKIQLPYIPLLNSETIKEDSSYIREQVNKIGTEMIKRKVSRARTTNPKYWFEIENEKGEVIALSKSYTNYKERDADIAFIRNLI